MLDEKLVKKLKKVLNPKRFRFVVILYEHSSDIEKIKEYIAKEYNNTTQTALDTKNMSYSEISKYLYTSNTFNYIDDFSTLLENRELYSAFNQRRDKISQYAMNLIVFYPKKLSDKLFQTAFVLIPDLWEFRSAVLTLESTRDEIKDIELKEFGLQYEYNGMNQKEKEIEIVRLEKRLEDEKTKDYERANLLNNLAGLYESIGEYQKAEPLYLKSLKISEKVLGKEHPSTATLYNNLAVFYYNQEEHKKAYELIKKAVDIWSKILPENHPNLINAKEGLERIERELNKKVPLVSTKKIKRNTLCSCNSGKKYKKCCGRNS